MVVTHGEEPARDAGLELVDVPVKLPELGYEWALSGLSEVLGDPRRPLPGLRA